MPIVDSSPLEGRAPKEPHLGVLTHADGRFLAIPPGSMMVVVMHPGQAEGVTPIILEKVSLRNWHFKCGCGHKQCTKRLRLAAIWDGHHPAASERGNVASSNEEQ